MLGVKCSLALRWSILILLPLTIAWKLAVKPENPIEIEDAIVEFLAHQHFDITVTKETMHYIPIIEASSASCSLRVMRVSPLGDEANVVHSFGGSTDHIFSFSQKCLYPAAGLADPRQLFVVQISSRARVGVTHSACDRRRFVVQR